MKASLSDDYQTQERNNRLDRIPNFAVEAGKTWIIKPEMRVQGNQKLNFEIECKYAGTVQEGGKTLDKIEVKYKTIKYSMEANGQIPLTLKKSDLKVADSEGEILFDRELGRVVKSKEKFHITGDLEFEANNQPLPGKLDLTIETLETVH